MTIALVLKYCNLNIRKHVRTTFVTCLSSGCLVTYNSLWYKAIENPPPPSFPRCYFTMNELKLLFLSFALTTCSASLSEPWNEEEVEWVRTSIDYVRGSIWPKPQSYNASGKVYTLTPSEFSFDSTGETSDVLKEAFTRYSDLVFPDPSEKPKAGLPQITRLSVKVEEKYAPLSLDSDESCK